MTIGDRVRIIATYGIWKDFYNMEGTITEEFISVWGCHKFIVHFDSVFHEKNHPPIIGFDFPDRCLELVK